MKKNVTIAILALALAVCLGVIVCQCITCRGKCEEEKAVISSFELLSNTGKYNGKEIKVEGFLEFNDDRSAIYVLRECCEEGVYKNGVWLDVSGLNENAADTLKSMDGEFVFVEGTYDRKQCGPKDAFSGSMKITSFKKVRR